VARTRAHARTRACTGSQAAGPWVYISIYILYINYIYYIYVSRLLDAGFAVARVVVSCWKLCGFSRIRIIVLVCVAL